ncbi:MAG: HEAT repeat domain-containing protein [Deltaproteobacteria bacterium]|nr:MAG: HEAT repeat domain-containing protein [Deltaproteobacteria bacterium]
MNADSDTVKRKWVCLSGYTVRLKGRCFDKLREPFLLTAGIFLALPGGAAANMVMGWSEFSPGIGIFLFFIEAVFFWLYAAKIINNRVNFGWILLVTFLANVVTFIVGVLIVEFVIFRIHTENFLTIGSAFVFTVLIEWGIYVLFFHQKIPRFTRLLKISFWGNSITYILIAVAYMVYLTNPHPPSYNRIAQTDLQNATAAQASYFSEHGEFCGSIDELTVEEDLILNKDVIIQVVFADCDDFKIVAFHKRGNNGYKIIAPAGHIDTISTEDAAALIEKAEERREAIAAGLDHDELIDENWDIRIQKAIRLGNVNDNSPQVDFLIEALNDERVWVRKDAARFLGVINASRSLEPLIDAMKNDLDWNVRFEAQQTLVKMKDIGAIELLIETLENEELDIEIRVAAAGALAATKDAGAVDPLIDALEYPERWLGDIAVNALGEIGDLRAVEPLIAVLKEENSALQRDAARALGKLKDPRAVEPLIAALQDRKWWVRKSAASALSEIPDPRAIGPLIAAFSDWYAAVRHSAAATLGRLSDSHGIELLVVATTDERWWVREAATLALGMTKDSRAADPLVDALRDVRPEVRRTAATALGKIEDSRAVESLIEALTDEDSSVKGNSARALGKIGDSIAVRALIAMIDDKVPYVQHGVLTALQEITGVPRYHRWDRSGWLEWWEQNQADYLQENEDIIEKRGAKTPDKKKEPPKSRKKKETVSIVGTWKLLVPGTNCVESVTFNSDNTFTIISNQEIQKGFYTYQKTVKTGKRHKITTSLNYDNGLPDCKGRENNLKNHRATDYLEFESDGRAFTLFRKPSRSEVLIGLYKKDE